MLIVIGVELQEPKGFGRIRLRRIPDDSASSVIPFVEDEIAAGATVRTDGSAAYLKLNELGYHHERKVMLGASEPAHVSMPGVHRIASLVKRWLMGTHQGSVQHGQLDYYLEEFVFRFNRRSSLARGLLFYRLMEQAVRTSPITYADVVRKGARESKKGLVELS